MKFWSLLTSLILFFVLLSPVALYSQTTTFSYQGNLEDGGSPASGNYDFEFRLYDQLTNGNQIGPVVSIDGVEVVGGSFSVTLDFGSEFPGADRWIEIRVRQGTALTGNEDLGGFTILAPRQPINSVPYAIRSSSSATADSATTAATANNADNLGGVASGQYVVTTDPRLSDARTPTSGSPDYIQNGTVQQPSSDFNITGTGKAAILEAETQFNLDGSRVLSVDGASNLFVGVNTGTVNTTGSGNSFAGSNAGSANTTGFNNSFYGKSSGAVNSEGSDNSFFGSSAGVLSTVGTNNSFLGSSSGSGNTSGNFNSFFGALSGRNNTEGNGNSFFGTGAGFNNRTGEYNTAIGYNADVSNFSLRFATAIGANSVVSSNDTIVLGRSGGQDTVVIPGQLSVSGGILGGLPTGDPGYIHNSMSQQASSNFNISGTGRAAIFDASAQFDIGGNRIISNAGTDNLFIGTGAGAANSTGYGNSFAGADSGVSNTSGFNNAYFGFLAGSNNTVGSNNAFFGAGAGTNNISANENAFFGTSAGLKTTTGDNNSFFGSLTGFNNTTGKDNAFFGTASGNDNTVGTDNSFFGKSAGQKTTTGTFNSFIGRGGGFTNTTGANNTTVGALADVGSNNLTYATAIGSGAVVSSSNTVLLGRANGSDDVALFGNLGIGTESPGNKFELSVNSAQLTMGGGGCPSGSIVIGFNGTLSGCTNYSIRGRNSSDLMLNRPTGGQVIFRENNGSAQVILHPGGEFEVRQLGSAGLTSLCRNGSNRIATCSSSLRYKNNIESFSGGLDLLNRLRPVTFNWKDSGVRDLGLVAEDVANVDPLLVTYDENGAVEGVKYDRIGVLLVNVAKAQQNEIEELRSRNERLEGEITEMREAFCAMLPQSRICK